MFKKKCCIIPVAFILLTSCEISRCLVYNFAYIKYYKIFPSRITKAGTSKFYFTDAKVNAGSPIPKTISLEGKKGIPFEKFLRSKSTVAFLVIHDDTILYEKYLKNYQRSSIVSSFSIAKSVTSTLVGCAIDDGYIASIDQPVTDYVPELKQQGLDKV